MNWLAWIPLRQQISHSDGKDFGEVKKLEFVNMNPATFELGHLAARKWPTGIKQAVGQVFLRPVAFVPQLGDAPTNKILLPWLHSTPRTTNGIESSVPGVKEWWRRRKVFRTITRQSLSSALITRRAFMSLTTRGFPRRDNVDAAGKTVTR